MLDGAGGTVGVKHLQPVTPNDHFIADGFQRACRFLCQQSTRLLIAVDPFSDKIVG